MMLSAVMSAIMFSLYVILGYHPIVDGTWNDVIRITLNIIYWILLCVTFNQESKMENRIKCLEEKIKEKEGR